MHQEHKETLKAQFPSQGIIISFLLDQSLGTLNSLCSFVESKLPKSTSITSYLIARISTHGNSHRHQTFLFASIKSLLHVIASCKGYLEDGLYTWRHNSALHFVESTLQYIKNTALDVDLPDFLSLCILTGAPFGPPFASLHWKGNDLYREVIVGFETNMNINAAMKRGK